jgi:hypothetical protein
LKEPIIIGCIAAGFLANFRKKPVNSFVRRGKRYGGVRACEHEIAPTSIIFEGAWSQTG